MGPTTATAVDGVDSRNALRFLVDEQAALRRIATLVAEAREPGEIFDSLGREVCRLLDADATRLTRYDPERGVAVVVGGHGDPGDHMPVGGTYSLRSETAIAQVTEGGAAVRLEPQAMPTGELRERLRSMGITTTVQAPIMVEGRRWGTLGVAWRRHAAAPAGVEDHVARFTEAAATAVASAVTREALQRLAGKQAALRRVATLVARGAPPAEVFEAMAHEARALMNVDGSTLLRYGGGSTAMVMALDMGAQVPLKAGDVLSMNGDSATARVRRTGRAARIETYDGIPGPLADIQRSAGHRAAVGAPVVVERELWGALVLTWAGDRRIPATAEEDLADFTELMAAAIANTESRAELTASRARIVLAADEARRRIQRDLHDGAQQRLISLALEVRTAQQELRSAGVPEPGAVDALLERVVAGLGDAGRELQDIARGLHPSALTRGGLDRALRTLARGSAVPVELSVDLPGRLPQPLELAAYYLVSEALTNAAKHSAASSVEVTVARQGDELTVVVSDDGIGDADPARGTGLTGLSDRVEALGGRLGIASARGRGTTLTMSLPLAAPGAEAGQA